ncbi:MAG: transketolase [Burkholderiales bacterium]|nr:transketolase [Anaerolineae bacterium]
MATLTPTDVQELAINSIRVLAMDAVQKADSGHPGLPMGAAPMAYALWMRHMRFNPHNPKWANRDRFVLSGGHGSMLLYALLYLTGYDLSLDELKNFRQWESKTPGHPENFMTPGVEATTGPLGQGTANAVGMALAEAYLASYFNRPGYEIVNHYTYAIVSDGDMMEGISGEAASLAGHWGLGKLIYLYDDNQVMLDGPTNIAFSEDVLARYEAYGWHTQRVMDGNNVEGINDAISAATAVTDKPSIIAVRTIIGFGSPHFQGTSEAHGKALGKDEVKLVKEGFGWPQEDFYVPGEALEHFREAVDQGARYEREWDETYQAWRAEYPDLAADWDRAQSGQLPDGWDADLPSYAPDKKVATRVAGGDALNAIAKHIPTMIGGDADLAGSTRTLIKGEANTAQGKPAARNVRFGVREHAMGAIANGLAYHGGIIKPYTATFLTFSDYQRPALRLGALSHLETVAVFTHDSIGLGEDGPTHQPIEQVMSLRLIPRMKLFRPADANETAAAWKTIMQVKDGPVCIALTRQNLPILTGEGIGGVEAVYAGVAKGGYVLADSGGTPDVILMGTGSEVHIAHEAYKTLTADGVKARLVSLPCWELFEAQNADYKESVLPKNVRARVSIEAGVTTGWQRFVGLDGVAIGLDRFGASAPYEGVYQELGITADAVLQAARKLLK